jgi:orotate phosphoribosyltransferase
MTQPDTAIKKFTGAGLFVKDVVVLADRHSSAKESLEQAGFHLHFAGLLGVHGKGGKG